MVYISQLLSAKYKNNMHTITFKSNHKFQQLYRSREKQNYLESCRDVVEMDLDIKQLEQCKRKIEEDLAEVNSQLSSIKKNVMQTWKREILVSEMHLYKS